MKLQNSKLARLSVAAASLFLTHCAGGANNAPDTQARAAAVARMQPLVTTVGTYASTLSVVSTDQAATTAMQAANTLQQVLAPAQKAPAPKVLRAIKSVRRVAALPTDDVKSFLNTRVFTASNVESVSGDTTTYLLHGDVFCNDANAAAQDPNAGPAGCAQTVDQMAIRFIVTSQGQNQSIALRVGAATDDVLTATYNAQDQSIAVDGDVAQLQTVLGTLNKSNQPNVQATGHIDLTLAQAGSKQASLSWGFASNVNITTQDGNTTEVVTLAAAPQAFSMSANDTQWTVAWNLQAVDVAKSTVGGSTLKAHLAGLSGHVSGDASSQDALVISGVSLGQGPSTITQDDQVLAQVEINADANHTFDLSVGAQDGNGVQSVTISPALNVTVKAAMAPVAQTYKVPSELLDNNYTLALTNNGQPAMVNLINGDALGIFDGSLQMVQGQMVLTSTQGNVTVAAGQCLIRNPDATRGASWVTEQQAGACENQD